MSENEIKSQLVARATVELEKKIEDELEIPDPDPEKAKAALDGPATS